MQFIAKQADTIIIVICAILIVLGMAILASASSHIGAAQFGDAHHFIRQQFIFGFGVGIVAFFVAMFIPLKFLKKYSFALLLMSIVLLILVFTPLGADFGTANRWIDIAGIQFQPSEIIKLTFITYIAAWLTSKNKDRKKDFFEGLLPFMIISGIIGALLLAQPSTSVVVLLMLSALIVYFAGGIKLSFIAIMGFVGALVLAIMIAITPYRAARVMSFLNPDIDTRGSAFHVNQSMMMIGSGGLTGVGYGESTFKIFFLPEPAGDSIFAIIAEELGFIGSMFFIFLYFLLVFTGFMGSTKTRTDFGKLILIGFSSIIGIQTFMHIASVSGLTPMTGIPLPFISYGGTALIIFMAITGLMVNAFRNG